MDTCEQYINDGSGDEALREMQQRHSKLLEGWGLTHKARRYLVERAGSRQIENDLLTATTIILGSTNGNETCLYVGFQRLTDDGSDRTKIVLIGTKPNPAQDYEPDPNSYFNDTDCRVASELFDELIVFQQTIMPNYDLQFGIVR